MKEWRSSYNRLHILDITDDIWIKLYEVEKYYGFTGEVNISNDKETFTILTNDYDGSLEEAKVSIINDFKKFLDDLRKELDN